MRRNRYENHYRSTLPVNGVSTFETSQRTKLTRNAGKVEVSCGYCDLIFEKYACHAKRVANHFCSVSCNAEARKIRFPKNCVVCNTEMMLTATCMQRINTCSKDCLRKNRTNLTVTRVRSAAISYTKIADKLKKNAVCVLCETTVGPWSVLGIKTFIENGTVEANGSQAKLFCRDCHLKQASTTALKSGYMVDRFKYYRESK